MPFMTANSFVGLGIESTRGTASSNVKFVPVTSPQVTPQQMWLRDDALRSSPVDNYGEILGVRHDEYDFKGYVFADTFPLLVKGALGYEAVTGSSTPYTHTLGLYNNAANASQPPAITIQDFDGDNTFQMTAGQVGDLNMKFTAEGALEYDAKLMANPFTKISNPTQSFSSEVFVPAWNTTMTIAGTSTAVLAEGEINIKRNTAPIFTAQGSNSPYRLFAGPANVSGKFMFVLESSDPILYNGSSNGYGLTASTQAVVLTFTDPVSSHYVKVQMTSVQFEMPKRTRGKAYVEVETEFQAVANTTDAIAGAGAGYAPIQVVATNAVSTTY